MYILEELSIMWYSLYHNKFSSYNFYNILYNFICINKKEGKSMKLKRFLSTFLASTMIFSMMSITVNAQNMLMEDAKNSWASKSIERWVAEGIVSGDQNGNFNPGKSLTRAEFAVILSNLLGLTEVANNTYDDLPDNAWYTEAILKCTAAGIMYGSADNGKLNSNPNATITRQEAMVMFGRAIGVEPEANPNLSQFTDGSRVPDWAAGYVSKMVDLGIISGVGNGMLGSNSKIDRAATMAILDRAISEYVTEPGTVTTDNNKGFVVINIPENDDKQVIIKGETEGVLVSSGTGNTEVIIDSLKTNSLKVDSNSKVTLDGITTITNITANNLSNVIINEESSATNITANDEASITILGKVGNTTVNDSSNVENKGIITNLEINGQSSIKNEGTITNTSINNQVTIENTGKIENTNINSDKVIIDGNKPDNIYINESVTEKPSTSTGDEIDATVDTPIDMPPSSSTPEQEEPNQGGSSSGGSSSGGSSSTPAYRINMKFMGSDVSTTVSRSSNFSAAFSNLIDKVDTGFASYLLDYVKLADDQGRLDGWQAYYDNYDENVDMAINNSGLGSEDITAAKDLLNGINPENVLSGTTDTQKLVSGMKELFVNINNSNVEDFKTLFDNLYNENVKITVNGRAITDPSERDELATILHNGSLKELYNYFNSNKNSDNEICIFFQFGDSTPEVEYLGETMGLDTLVGLTLSMTATSY